VNNLGTGSLQPSLQPNLFNISQSLSSEVTKLNQLFNSNFNQQPLLLPNLENNNCHPKFNSIVNNHLINNQFQNQINFPFNQSYNGAFDTQHANNNLKNVIHQNSIEKELLTQHMLNHKRGRDEMHNMNFDVNKNGNLKNMEIIPSTEDYLTQLSKLIGIYNKPLISLNSNVNNISEQIQNCSPERRSRTSSPTKENRDGKKGKGQF
jgi:hypothetical protein